MNNDRNMNSIVPASRPQRLETLTRDILRAHGVKHDIALVGVRGYYKSTMGKPNQNDRSIYDDAIFLVSPRLYLAFNANTDPSLYGVNEKIGKGLAVLQPGLWLYKVGLHGVSRGRKPYTALVQAAPVEVLRDGGVREKGFLAINIHKGSFHGTSSEGCQTVFPTQFDEFIETVCAELSHYNQEIIPYLLTEQA